MQKVVGSNPISRFHRSPCKAGSSNAEGARRRPYSWPDSGLNDSGVRVHRVERSARSDVEAAPRGDERGAAPSVGAVAHTPTLDK